MCVCVFDSDVCVRGGRLWTFRNSDTLTDVSQHNTHTYTGNTQGSVSEGRGALI